MSRGHTHSPVGAVSAVSIAQVMADPLRLELLQRLMQGTAAVGELVALTGASQPRVSNHLRLLRERGLVQTSRSGRHVTYSIAGAEVAQLMEALIVVGGGARPGRASDPLLMQARTCYDHLAGVLGVWILERLVALRAVEAAGEIRGDLALGSQAGRWLAVLGVEPALAARSRRRFAFGCLDWTERRPHLGGALAAQLCEQALARGWVARLPRTRAVRLTPEGRGVFAALGALPDRLAVPAGVGSDS